LLHPEVEDFAGELFLLEEEIELEGDFLIEFLILYDECELGLLLCVPLNEELGGVGAVGLYELACHFKQFIICSA